MAPARSDRTSALRAISAATLAAALEPCADARAPRGALAAGAGKSRAVDVLARRAGRAQPAPLTGLDERLQAGARPEPDLHDYDRLLGAEARR